MRKTSSAKRATRKYQTYPSSTSFTPLKRVTAALLSIFFLEHLRLTTTLLSTVNEAGAKYENKTMKEPKNRRDVQFYDESLVCDVFGGRSAIGYYIHFWRLVIDEI